MNTGGLILIIGSLLSSTVAFLWLIWRLDSRAPAKKGVKDIQGEVGQAAAADVEHIFDDEFREELRNRGRLHFEKIIGENAMFLQQDLRETTAQLNEYMRAELTRTLQDEFKNYQQSISDAKQIALNSIEKTITTIEQQRQFMEQQLLSQSQANKARMIKQLETDMATILNHYIVKAIGNQIDLTDQLDYILDELQINKQAILEDIKNGTA
jgi:F0F1-type ATP synthase membrane subunit b/b'